MKLPVIVQRNAWTLPQERYNADWVIDKKVGIVVDDFTQDSTRRYRNCWNPPGFASFSLVLQRSTTGRYSRSSRSWTQSWTQAEASPRTHQPQIVLPVILSLPPGPVQ